MACLLLLLVVVVLVLLLLLVVLVLVLVMLLVHMVVVAVLLDMVMVTHRPRVRVIHCRACMYISHHMAISRTSKVNNSAYYQSKKNTARNMRV